MVNDPFRATSGSGHPYLSRPATERWDLGQKIRSGIQAWSEVPWGDLDADEDPRQLFGLDELRFGTRSGLWPIASTDLGEVIFLVLQPYFSITAGKR
ncbi:hypothetical protein [Streptomyces sp. NPDC059349]|uniref:hypothetical protein n=1 Tax=Streptomyces sp. NPDC059349 TaxID=3346808 RepID=UPI0036B9AEE4